MGELSGQVAIVTGGSRGIGRAIAVALAEHGPTIVLVGRDRAMLDESVALVNKAGGKGVPHEAELTDPAAPAALVDQVKQEFGRLDIVVGNAGSTRAGAFLATTDELWADGFAVKFFSHVRLSKAAWPLLMESRGHWLSISGAKARTPTADFTIGSSVNTAYMAFTKSLADLGLRDGVQVNCVNPGSVNTARLEGRLQVIMKNKDVSHQEAWDEYARMHGKILEPEDVAGLVAFVLTKQGRYFHGAALDLDGGVTPGLV